MKIHPLFIADIVLIVLTIVGAWVAYYYFSANPRLLIATCALYVSSKIIGFIVCPYVKFAKFIEVLTLSSQSASLSGFSLFKSLLIGMLFLGYVFISPVFWIVESVLVVAMRVWARQFTGKI